MRRGTVIILLLLALAASMGCSIGTNITPGGNTPVAKTWQQVIEFTGSSMKTTQKFSIGSNEWRIRWTTTPGANGDGNFVIYVYAGNGDMVDVAANIIGKGADTSYVYAGGEYYLTILSDQNYDIVIEQNK